MNLAVIEVSGVQARAQRFVAIPAGIVGATVTFVFTDPIWDGYHKTAVFSGCETRDVVMDGNTVVIPHEAVAKAGGNLRIGVYGTDADNDIGIPTLWAVVGAIREAADPSGDPSADPTLPIWVEIQKQLGDGIPTKVSQLENDAGYLKDGDKVSQLENDAGYLKDRDKVSHLENDAGYLTEEEFLTENEIDMLSKILMGGSLVCDPVIEASVTKRVESKYNSQGDYMYNMYYWDISGVITGIDQSLIQKVEVGGYHQGNYTYKDATLTSTDDTTHSATGTLGISQVSGYYTKFVVRLTYYTVFGQSKTLISDEVMVTT